MVSSFSISLNINSTGIPWKLASSASFWPRRPLQSLSHRPPVAASNFRRVCATSLLPTLPPLPLPIIKDNDSLLKYLRQQPDLTLLPPEMKEGERTMELLLERMSRELRFGSADAGDDKYVGRMMKLIDHVQRLGMSYHFEDEINKLLQVFLNHDKLLHYNDDDDLFTAALGFRLLRHNGYSVTPDVFKKFMDKNGKFKESIIKDTKGILCLYEACFLGSNDENVLLEAKQFTEFWLKESLPAMTPKLSRQVLMALELPRHHRMDRLEARNFIEEYENEPDHNKTLLELAKLDYNRVQVLHQMELTEISRWWKQLGLIEKLTFARDRPLECFFWTVGILPEPKYSSTRVELAKTIAILLVIDDIFDTYGSPNDLVIFTGAIRRWDLNAIEELPEYMKICYMALYNTTNEICYKVLKEHGLSVVLPHLKRTWIDMIEGFLIEAKWMSKGYIPSLEEYIENGVTTAGTYMALVHIFFLIGGVTNENVKLLQRPYPKLFSHSGRILRLWDDLGTAKEEQERGDIASSIQILMKEKNISRESEGRRQVLELILKLWRELNSELSVAQKSSLPLSMIKVALNMARTSQVVYQHEEDATYFSNVDNYVKSLFFTYVI